MSVMRRFRCLVFGIALLFGMTLGAQAADPIKIGWTAWSDAEFMTKLTKKVLEDRMGYDVELIQTDIAPQYQGIATGSIDLMLMSWLPGTHQDYMDKTCTKVVNLGVLYTHARLGWVVPDYIPASEVASIADLKKDSVNDKLDGTITGIDPGAGLTRLSKKVIKKYSLNDYDLQISSGAGMTAALERAVRRNEWIVVTGWSPHWKFGRWNLRYLEDPKGVLGSYERIHAIAREGFYQQNVEAAAMITRMHLPIDQLEAAMNKAQETSYEEAVNDYIANHPERINYWISGEFK